MQFTSLPITLVKPLSSSLLRDSVDRQRLHMPPEVVGLQVSSQVECKLYHMSLNQPAVNMATQIIIRGIPINPSVHPQIPMVYHISMDSLLSSQLQLAFLTPAPLNKAILVSDPISPHPTAHPNTAMQDHLSSPFKAWYPDSL